MITGVFFAMFIFRPSCLLQVHRRKTAFVQMLWRVVTNYIFGKLSVDVINLKLHTMSYIHMVVPPSDHLYDCKYICSGNIFANKRMKARWRILLCEQNLSEVNQDKSPQP